MSVAKWVQGGSVSTVGLVLVLLVMTGAFTGCPRDTKAPGPVTELTAAGGDGAIVLSWKNPADDDFDHVTIVRKMDGPPTAVTDGTVAYEGSASTFQDSGLVNDTEYFYAVYAYDESGNRSDAVIASASPLVDTVAEQTGELAQDIAEVPDAILPPASRQALRDKLASAGDKYEDGDPCGAAGDLEDYLGLAQNLRQGAAAATVEDLYNRGRMLRFNMILPMPEKANCPGAERVGKQATALPAEESAELLDAETEFGEPKLLTVQAEGDTYTQLVIPGVEDWSGTPGDPAVPMLRRLVGVPIGAECSIDVSCVEAETIRMKLYPAQDEPVDADDPFATPPFVRNEKTYATNAFYPAEHYNFTFVGEMREMRLFLLEVPAGQYNPVTEELRLFKDVRADIKFQGGAGGFIRENTAHAFDNQTPRIAELAINNVSIVKDVLVANAAEILGEEFMILTPPDLKSAADTLASWKRKKGISTQVFTVMDGEDSGPDTNTTIDELIHDEYNYSKIRPSYVLLLGDANLIPCFYPAAQGSVGSATIGSDWQYAILGDPATDKVPDFAVGRIPAKTLEEAEAVVNKIIAYEETPPENADFYRNAAIAAQFECCRTDITQKGYDARTFIEASEFARSALRAANKTVDRIYKKTVYSSYSGDSTPRRYFDGGLLPAEIGPGYAWNGSTTDIINAFNAGRFLFIHRDHGEPTGWCTPSFYNSNLDGINNGALQPVIYSINCASGLWDNETASGALGTTASGNYILERLLRDPDGGAVGIIGDTRNSPSWANSALLRGMIDATWPSALSNYGGNTSKRRLGDILNHGKLYMWTQIGAFEIDNAKAEDQLRLWHVIGDPTLEIWTRDPHAFPLPAFVRADVLKAAINIGYTQDDAVITAFEVHPQGPPVPLARGTVKGGVATLPFIKEYSGRYPVIYVANHENAKSVELKVEKDPIAAK